MLHLKDLHGFWDKDVKTLEQVVRGQSDIRDIANDTLPLWFDELDPSKINFGIALYGRGYTVTDPSCNALGCPFKGPSKPGICSHTDGAMGLSEIEDLIKNKDLTPRYVSIVPPQYPWMGCSDSAVTLDIYPRR